MFKDEPVALFNRIKAETDVKNLRLGWRWCVAGSEDSSWKLETIVDAAGYQLDAKYKDYIPTWPFTRLGKDDVHATVGLPLLGLSLGLKPLDWLGFFAEGSGMYAGDYGYLFDTLGGVNFAPQMAVVPSRLSLFQRQGRIPSTRTPKSTSWDRL